MPLLHSAMVEWLESLRVTTWEINWEMGVTKTTKCIFLKFVSNKCLRMQTTTCFTNNYLCIYNRYLPFLDQGSLWIFVHSYSGKDCCRYVGWGSLYFTSIDSELNWIFSFNSFAFGAWDYQQNCFSQVYSTNKFVINSSIIKRPGAAGAVHD